MVLTVVAIIEAEPGAATQVTVRSGCGTVLKDLPADGFEIVRRLPSPVSWPAGRVG